MDDILLLDATERYLRGEMDEAEKTSFEELVGLMVEADLELLSTPGDRRPPSFSSDVW